MNECCEVWHRVDPQRQVCKVCGGPIKPLGEEKRREMWGRPPLSELPAFPRPEAKKRGGKR